MKILKEIASYAILISAVLFVRVFIITAVSVDGLSMYPTLKDNELLLLKRYDKKIERFDIIVFQYGDSKLIKRVIGMPGETVEYKNNQLYINDNKIDDVIITGTDDFSLRGEGISKIPRNMFFVLGDNRGNSSDSRTIGLISLEDIEGTVSFRLFPFNKFGSIE